MRRHADTNSLALCVSALLPLNLPSAQVRTVLSPPPNATQIAALAARATALIERVEREGKKLAPHKRAELETELALVKRLLEMLGYRGTA